MINTDFTATEGTAIGSNEGTIEVNNGAQFSVGGTVKNVNTINVNSGKLAVDDFDLTVNGGGLIGLGGNGATLVVSAGRTLVNVDNTIAGEGTIIDALDAWSMNPSGIIEATDSSGTLFLDELPTKKRKATIEAIDLLPRAGYRSMLRSSTIRVAALSTRAELINRGIGTLFLQPPFIIGGTVTARVGLRDALITGTNVTFDGGKSVELSNTMITIKGKMLTLTPMRY